MSKEQARTLCKSVVGHIRPSQMVLENGFPVDASIDEKKGNSMMYLHFDHSQFGNPRTPSNLATELDGMTEINVILGSGTINSGEIVRCGSRNSHSYVKWPQASTRKDMSHGNAT